MKKEIPDKLWTDKDVMSFLGIKRTKLWELTSMGELPRIKIGRENRYIPEDIYKWAKKQAS